MEDRSQAAVGSPTRSQPILPQECPPKVLGKPEWLPLDEKEQLVYEHLLHELGPTDVARVTHIKLTCFLRGFQDAVPRVGLTAQAVRRHIAWQDEIGLHDLLFAPPSDLVDRHQEWRRGWHYEIVGADVMGHPIACHRLGQVDLDDLLTRFTVDQMRQHVVRDMELVDQIKRNISAEVGYRVYKTTLVIDLEGMTWGKHLSTVFKDNLKMATSLLIENYPETIWRVYIINAPAIFRFAWTFIRPMLTGDMIAKVTVIGASAEKIKQVLHLGGVALDKVSIASEGPAALWALGEEAVRKRAYRLQDTVAAAAAATAAAPQPVPASQPKGRRSPGRAGFAANHSGSAREIADRRKRSPKLREKRPPSGAGAARGNVPVTPEPQRGSAAAPGGADGAWNSPPSSVETVFATPPTALDESLPVFTPHTALTGRQQSATGRRRGGWLSCGAPALCGGVGAGKGATKYSRAATTASEAAEADRDGAAAVSAAAFAAVLPAKKTPAARAGAASKGVKGSGSAHTQPGLDETVDVVQQRKRRSRGRQYPNRAQRPAVPPRDAIMHYGGGSSSSSDNGDNSPVGTASDVEGELGSSSEWRDGDGESPEAARREQACPSPNSMISRLMANRWRTELDLNEEKNEQRTREMVARGQKRSGGHSGCHRVGAVCWEDVIQRTIACLSCGWCCAGAAGGRAERHVGRVYSSAET